MEFLQKLRLVWAKVTLSQRILLLAVVLAAVGAGSLVVYWAGRPDYRLLYAGLDPEDASKVVDDLQSKGIDYQLKDGGTSIWVDQSKLYELRLALARDGYPSKKQQGFEMFDNEKIGVSPFVQNVDYKRALQNELAKSIQMIDGVSEARVLIDTPKSNLFTPKGQNATASVTLKIQPGYSISSANIAAITNLVSGGVTGLSPEHVTIVDDRGRLLSNPSDPFFGSGVGGTLQDYKERVEASIQKKAEALLTAALGPGKATVMVTAEVDMHKTRTVTERPTTPQGVLSKSEEVENNQSEPPAKGQSEGKTSSESTTTNEYANYKTVEQEESLPGSITSLYVGAIVDLRSHDPNAAPGTLIMQVNDVEDMLKTALGLKESRGDTVKVSNVPMGDITPPKDVKASPWPMYLAIARHASMGVMALCALLVFMIMSRARKKAVQAEIRSMGQLGPGAEVGLLNAAEAEPTMVRRQIAHALKNNPEQVKQLFASWIQES